ncbi:class I SAM-dependent methyltransferase [Alloacidobacterium dinghuense]|nr:class I SAM-dependent methyltransferase [Alloacidobacterium dinghuense]
MRNEKDIGQAIPSARLAHFSRFIEDYQTIRAAEGRGSLQEDFYLNLPYQDVTGKNAWQWKIRARTFDCLIKKVLPQIIHDRKQSPIVLDLGAGNGWMSYRLALAGYKPIAVDILTNDQDGLGAAVHFEKHLDHLFPRFRAEMSRLPFADDQFDAVIFNASFHYAEDDQAAIREALRCTKKHGAVIIADSPWYSAAKSGEQMVAERQAAFTKQYGTASDSIASVEYLTDKRLAHLEQAFNVRWERDTPFYGLQWTVRPLLAKLRGRREPSRFRIYSARKTA